MFAAPRAVREATGLLLTLAAEPFRATAEWLCALAEWADPVPAFTAEDYMRAAAVIAATEDRRTPLP